MKSIIWRSRASALLGLLVIFIPLMGIPSSMKTILLVILGMLIIVFGLAKSHYASGYAHDYEKALKNHSQTMEKGTDLNEEKND